MTAIPTPTLSRHALRVPLLIALGAIFWLLAALVFRFLGPSVFTPDSAVLFIVFALAVPVAWGFVWLGTTLAGVRGEAVMPAVVIMSVTAMLLDGVALTWFPSLYGMPPDSLVIVGACLLWGVGWILAIAYLWNRRGG